eukprot:3929940-Rhodomonas_salina.2
MSPSASCSTKSVLVQMSPSSFCPCCPKKNTGVSFFEIGKKEDHEQWKILLAVFPNSMQQKLLEFDNDWDGNLNAAEVETRKVLMAHSLDRNLCSRLVKALVALLIFTLLLLLAMGLITFYIVDLAKEIKSNDNRVLNNTTVYS